MELMTTWRLTSVLVLSAVWLILWSAPVLAHARLLQAEPPAGANLEKNPEHVRLHFSEPVDAEFDPLEVYESDGNRVDKGSARVDPDDARVVEVGLEENLPAGSYEVQWRVTSIDGHVVEGAYDFTVTASGDESEGAAQADAEDAEEPEQQPAVQEEGAEEEPGSGSSSILLYSALSLGILGLAALVLVGGMRLRRRKP
jgi:methionine-rich copper-binding protein CopC